MHTNVAAFLMSLLEVLTLQVAFRLFLWKKWCDFWFGIMVPLSLAFVDGHYFWSNHTLLTNWMR